jgi:RNA polymerase sigma factor (sigma-70 family)
MAAGTDTLLRHIRCLVIPCEPGEATDAALLGRFIAARDERAFAVLVQRHGPLVLHVCRRVLGDGDDADDAFQAAFLILARKAVTLRQREALPAWLHGVARRVALKARSARARRLRDARPLAVPPADPRPDPLAELSARELLLIMDEEVQRLPEMYRLPVILCCLEGRSLEEAARQLGWTIGSVKGRLERGRARLHGRLVRRGLTLSAALAAAELSRAAGAAAGVARLVTPTVRGAMAFGARLAGGVSTPAATLAGDVLKGMALAKLKLGVALVLVLGVLTAAVGFGAYDGVFALAEGREPTQPAKPLPAVSDDQPQGQGLEQARTDTDGDPLPEGAIKRVGTLRFRLGGGSVIGLFLGADGKTLISNTMNGARAVQVWEPTTGKLIRTFPGNYEYEPVAVSPDGNTLAIPEGRGTKIGLWDVASGKAIRRLEAANVADVQALAFSPDGKTLAASDQSGTIHFWYPATGEHTSQHSIGTMEPVTLLAYSPDGKVLVTGNDQGKRLQLWDAATHRLLYALARPGNLNAVVFSPDGALLAASAENSPVALWQARTGRLVRELRSPLRVETLAFSPDGKVLATNELTPTPPHTDTVSFWEVATGKHLRRTKATPKFFSAPAFSADGKTVFVGSGWGTITGYEVATGKPVGPALEAPSSVHCLTVSLNGRTMAYARDDRIQVHDLSAGRESDLVLPAGPTSALAFAPDGRRLASVSGINQLCLWDVQSQKPVHRLTQTAPRSRQSHRATAFSPDGKWLATLRSDGMVQLWDARNGQKQRLLEFKGRPQFFGSSDLTFSPDGTLLAATGRTGNGNPLVCIWDATTWGALPELTAEMNAPTGEAPKMVPGRFFFGSWEPTVVHRLAFAPDGRTLAMNRWQQTIPVWEMASGKQRLVLQGHQESTVWVAYTRDGRTLASASWDNTIRLWDLETGKELRCLTGHRGKANSLAFTPDDNTLVSAGDDSTVLYWDVAAQTHRPSLASRLLSVKELESLWNELADADAGKAYRAMVALRSSPAECVALLGRHLEPAPGIDRQRLNRLLADLDSNGFAVRAKASADLEQLGELAVPALKKKLAENPSLEVRQRIRAILKNAGPVSSPVLLRQVRAVEVLEKMGTPPARQLLQRLAVGAPVARLTKEAAAALGRLGKGG